MAINHRSALILLTALAILVMSVHFCQYIFYAIKAVYYPFELFDAEGIVWQQAMLMPGPLMYGDINNYPFIVFHYPPLYHLLARTISLIGCTPLLAGRAISLVSAIFVAVTISRLTYRQTAPESGRLAGLLGCAIAGLAFFCFYPVVVTSTFMRVDMLAVAFSFAGLLCFTTSDIRSWRLYVGMTLFVLAVFTKQTSFAAPIATILVIGIISPKIATKLVLFGLLLGTVPLVILSVITKGGFLQHIVHYNINRYGLELVWHQLLEQASQIIFVFVALIGLVVWWRRFLPSVKNRGIAAWRDVLGRDSRARAMVMVALYFCLSTLTMAGLGKSGATIAYFDEWIGILCILIGYLVATVTAPNSASLLGDIKVSPAVILFLPVLLMFQVLKMPVKGLTDFSDKAQIQASHQLVDKIARADKPVLSSDMVLLMIAGKTVPWEPAIFAELASMGRWDETLITRKIAAHDFAFIVTRNDTQFTPAVTASVNAAYPRVEDLAEHRIHLPAD